MILFSKNSTYLRKTMISGAIALSLLSSPLSSLFSSSSVFASENIEAKNPLTLIEESNFNEKIDTAEELNYLYSKIDYIKSKNYLLSKLEQPGVIVNADLDYNNTPILVNQYSAFPFSLLEDSLEIDPHKVEYFYLADYSMHFPAETQKNDKFLAELSSDGIIFPKKLGRFQIVIRYNHHYFVRTVIVKTPDAVLPAQRVKQVEEIEKKITAKFKNLKPIDQVLGVHDYLVNTIRYGVLEEGTKRHNAQGKYGALVDKVAICEGYALGFSALMKRLGINARTVRGYIAGQKHAWNMVELDGEWYHIDVTADDIEFNSSTGTISPIMQYRYFLLDEKTLKHTHRDFTYHDGNGTKYRDYPLKDIKIDSLEEINSVLEKQFEKFNTKQGYIDLFAKNTLDRATLKKAVEDYFQGKNVSVDNAGFTNYSFNHEKPDYILQSIKITLNEALNNQIITFNHLQFHNNEEDKLLIELSQDIEDLSLMHLSLSGAQKKNLEKVDGTSGKYILTIDSYIKGSDLKLEIKKRGYEVNPSSKTVLLPSSEITEPEEDPHQNPSPNDDQNNANESTSPDGSNPPSSNEGSGGSVPSGGSGGSVPSGGGGGSVPSGGGGGSVPSGGGGGSVPSGGGGGSVPSGGGGGSDNSSQNDETPSDVNSSNLNHTDKEEIIFSAEKTDKTIENLLKNLNNHSSQTKSKKVEWNIEEQSNPNFISISLPKKTLKRIENANTRGLNIKSENFELFLSQSNLKYISKHSDEVVELKIIKDENNKSLYHCSLINAEGKQINKLGKHKLIISLPYQLKKNETPENIIAFAVDKKGNKKEISNSYYDQKTKKIRIATDFLSTFTIDFKKQKRENFLKGNKNKKNIDFVRNRNLLSFNSTTLNPDSTVTYKEFIEILAKLDQKQVNKKSYLKWTNSTKIMQKDSKQNLTKPINYKAFSKIMNQYSKSIGFTKKFKFQSKKNLSRSKIATLLRSYIESMNR